MQSPEGLEDTPFSHTRNIIKFVLLYWSSTSDFYIMTLIGILLARAAPAILHRKRQKKKKNANRISKKNALLTFTHGFIERKSFCDPQNENERRSWSVHCLVNAIMSARSMSGALELVDCYICNIILQGIQ